MRLLDRYLLRELMIPLLYCLGGFLIFFVSADLMNELPMLQGKGLNGWDIAEFYVFKLPELLPPCCRWACCSRSSTRWRSTASTTNSSPSAQQA